MYRNTEIKTIESWEWVWWDVERDEEFLHAVTGTPWKPLPILEQRLIQRIGGKQVHAPDDGELEYLPRDCDPLKAWVRCSACGTEILVEV